MIDTELATMLTDAGVSEDILPRLDLFGQVQRPEAVEDFFDSRPAAPATLTVGQVQMLRGALRVQVNRLIGFVAAQSEMGPLAAVLGLCPHDMDPQRDLAMFLDIEDSLALAYGESTPVTVPDSVPDWL